MYKPMKKEHRTGRCACCAGELGNYSADWWWRTNGQGRTYSPVAIPVCGWCKNYDERENGQAAQSARLKIAQGTA